MLRALLLFAIVAGVLAAQPAFEVASIKPSPPDAENVGTWRVSPGGLNVQNMSLKEIVKVAYSAQEYQYSGPGWLADVRYSIEAKPESQAADAKQLMAMLQTLLAEQIQVGGPS